MAIGNFDASTLLGKQVILSHRFGDRSSIHQGQVIAVLSVLTGSRASPCLMLDEGRDDCDYFDFEDITLQVVL